MTVKPTVCCVMLVNGREAMVRRAIASFRTQTYERKRLLVWNSGDPMARIPTANNGQEFYSRVVRGPNPTIGLLRNAANRWALEGIAGGADLIAHWDSDDWSHPRRLEEQVELLESYGKMCVGYRELLFWDTRHIPLSEVPGSALNDAPDAEAFVRNEAWIYRHPEPRWAAGASFLYRRELWQQQPFLDAPHEDQRWWCTPLVSRNCLGVSAIPECYYDGLRMICQMHTDSTEHIPRAVMESGGNGVWRRARLWDGHCERTMRL